MTKKESPLFHLIVVAAFIGILLTGAIFYITTATLGGNGVVAESCYDGSTFEGDGPFAAINRAVYQNTATLEQVREYQYRLFDVVHDKNVIAGKNNFLFEVQDTENDYNFLRDYLGEDRFTEQESAAILDLLQRRQQMYAARGAEYLLVILPNAQTVYSENMPSYLGEIRETRLDALDAYLLANGFENFANLTDELISYKAEGQLYNNTENSLNALGMYYTFRCVCDRFADELMAKTRILSRRELSFYYHLTTGKAVARRAGLAEVVSNRTVSLSNTTKLNYYKRAQSGYATETTALPFEGNYGAVETPSLLLQFSDTWESLQAEPFFSNTFSHVTYQTNLADNAEIYETAEPHVVIQFVYENQLSWLLPK